MVICMDGVFSKRPMLHIRWCAVRPAMFQFYSPADGLFLWPSRMKSFTLPPDNMYNSDQRA